MYPVKIGKSKRDKTNFSY